jgi:hypothetical protein
MKSPLMADSRWALDLIQTRQPLIVIQCKLMRVGELEGELEEPLFCKRYLYLDSLGEIRLEDIGRKLDRVGEDRAETLLQSEFCKHCKYTF